MKFFFFSMSVMLVEMAMSLGSCLKLLRDVGGKDIWLLFLMRWVGFRCGVVCIASYGFVRYFLFNIFFVLGRDLE